MPPSIPPCIFANDAIANTSPAFTALRDSPREPASQFAFPLPPSHPYPAIANTSLAFRTLQAAPPKSPSRSPSPSPTSSPSFNLHGSSKPHPNAFTGKAALPFRKLNDSKVSKERIGRSERQHKRKVEAANLPPSESQPKRQNNKKFRLDMKEMALLMGDTGLERPEPKGQYLYRERAAKTIAGERITAETTGLELPEPNQQHNSRERAAKTIARARITAEIHGRKRAAEVAKPIDELIGEMSGIDLAKEVGAHLKKNNNDKKKKEKGVKSQERKTERLARWAGFGAGFEGSKEKAKRELVREAEELGVEIPTPKTANRWATLRGIVEEARAKKAAADGEVDKDGMRC